MVIPEANISKLLSVSIHYLIHLFTFAGLCLNLQYLRRQNGRRKTSLPLLKVFYDKSPYHNELILNSASLKHSS